MIRGLYVLITEYTVGSKLNLRERFQRKSFPPHFLFTVHGVDVITCRH